MAISGFHENLRAFIDEAENMRWGCVVEGPKIVDMLCDECGSLREAARQVGLSPTYLSRVRTADTVLSEQRCLALLDFLERKKESKNKNRNNLHP